MIDLKLIRENIEYIKHLLKIRNMENAVDLVRLQEIDELRRSLIAEADGFREKRNKVSKEIGSRKAKGEPVDDIMQQVDGIADSIKSIDLKLEELEAEYNNLALSVPNVLDETVPEGRDDKDNIVVRTWGEKPHFDFTPKPHFDIGTELGILDFERGVKLAGTRFYVYRGLAAKLERALLSFMLDLHTTEHGYTETFGPFLVNDASMTGTGQYPKFQDEYYRFERDGLSLIPTAEVPLTNLYRDEILNKEDLPIYVTGQSSCFRREAGVCGKGYTRSCPCAPVSESGACQVC